MASSFLDEIALGRYITGNSPLHQARSSWKVLVFTLVAVATFFFKSASAFLILGIIVAILALACALPQKLFWRSLRPVNLLAIFTILAGAYINHPQASTLAPAFSWTGLHNGGLYAGRLFLITLLTTLFLLTTRPQAAISLGIKLLSPLRLLGIAKQELSLLVHLAYRFVPLLRRELKEMELGRKARNLPLPQSFSGKLQVATNKLVFMFVGALKRAETTSFALEQRRVLENWHQPEAEANKGFGGWMSLLLLLSAGLLLWKDGSLL